MNNLAATPLSVGTCQDLPAGISKLVVNIWETAEWLAWERVWRPELAKRGITPKMLELVGDPEHPTGIAACSPDGGSRSSGLIDWEADAERTAVLTGMRRLVAELDRAVLSVTHESLTSVATS